MIQVSDFVLEKWKWKVSEGIFLIHLIIRVFSCWAYPPAALGTGSLLFFAMPPPFPSFCWVSSVSLLVKITFDVKLDIDTAFDFAVGLALVNSAVVVANFSYYQRPDAVIL